MVNIEMNCYLEGVVYKMVTLFVIGMIHVLWYLPVMSNGSCRP